MVRTKIIARIGFDQRRQAARPRTRVKPVAVIRPPGQRRVPGQQIGVENIEGRIHNRTFKIKKMLLAEPKNVEVKKRSLVLQKMVVKRETIFPAEVRRTYY